MPHKLLTKEELTNWINTKLQESEECKSMRPISIYELKKPDEYGNNWVETDYRNYGDADLIDCKMQIEKVLIMAKNRFNLI